ncbi:MAG: hypothetical protein ABI759_23040 [Candidatus Solibacter sp.]
MYRFFTFLAAAAAITLPSSAQTLQRRATMVGGGGPDRGKCTIEVVVDGAADVTIRGDQGTIKNLNGRPAEWRRFECNAPLPTNANDFRFQGIDGRGRQQLTRDPRQGGAAVVRIEDTDGGSEGYTFDLLWGGYENPGRGPSGDYRGPSGDYRGPIDNRGPVDNRGPNGPGPHRFTTEQAVSTCQDSVRQDARNRFRGRRVEFLTTRIDDNPGRNDWVIGTLEVYRGRNLENYFRFSCAVDFNTGRVRSVDVEPRGLGKNWRGDSDRISQGSGRAVQNCQAAAEARVRRDGYNRVDVGSIRMDDAPGRNDWVVGNMRAFGPRGADAFNFSCSVDLRGGDVRSVNVDRR